MKEAMIRCWKCHEFVRVKFCPPVWPNKTHWFGECPSCESVNYIEKPSWTKELQKNAELERQADSEYCKVHDC